MLGTPQVLWLERKRVRTVIAVLLVVAGMIVVLLIVGGLVAHLSTAFIDGLPSYQQRIQEQVSALRTFLAREGHPGHGQGAA